MKLPFDSEGVRAELIGQTLILSKNEQLSAYFHVITETELSASGEASNIGTWETQDGALRLLDKNGGLAYEFRALETRRGVVYATGRSALEASRVILHKKLSMSDFGVCISSHVKYEAIAIPKLLKSLQSGGFDMKKVMVVVGGEKRADISNDPVFDVRTIRCKNNSLGFTALAGMNNELAGHPYWLLLHDTCDTTSGFIDKMSVLDVGLNPDAILFGPSSGLGEIGVYSSGFIQNCGEMNTTVKPYDAFKELMGKAQLVQIMPILAKKDAAKDIYGTGIKRETLSFQQLGIRKFKSKMGAGRP